MRDGEDFRVSNLSNRLLNADLDDLPSVDACHGQAWSNASVLDDTRGTHALVYSPGRLVPHPIFFWLRSRLAVAGEDSASNILAVAEWRWRLSGKSPSARQVDQVCGEYQLVYLRTTNVSSVSEMISKLGPFYQASCISAIFMITANLWEILIVRHSVHHFVQYTNHRGYTVVHDVHPGDPLGVEECREPRLKALERLIARAWIAQLASKDGSEDSIVAARIYCNLVELYQYHDVYRLVTSMPLPTDQPATAPGWSCVVGSSQYPSTTHLEEGQ